MFCPYCQLFDDELLWESMDRTGLTLSSMERGACNILTTFMTWETMLEVVTVAYG